MLPTFISATEIADLYTAKQVMVDTIAKLMKELGKTEETIMSDGVMYQFIRDFNELGEETMVCAVLGIPN